MASLEEMLAMDGVENIQVQKAQAQERVVAPMLPPSDHEPFFKNKMLNTIKEVREYSWSRGEMGGLDWGVEQFNKAFEGLNTGVHLIAGQSNVGS